MSFPAQLRGVVPAETAATWMSIRDVVPAGAYLGGGTAIALHLRHRTSRDLDFFLRHPVDLDRLVAALQDGRASLRSPVRSPAAADRAVAGQVEVVDEAYLPLLRGRGGNLAQRSGWEPTGKGSARSRSSML